MALPLLPTIVVAMIVSAASFLCQTPSAPVPETPASPRMVEMESRTAQAEPIETADLGAAFVPAAFAFRDQFPLRDPVAMTAGAAPRRATSRTAAAKPSQRRSDSARSEMAKAEATRPDASRAPSVVAAKAAAVSPEPFRIEAEADEDLVPRLALPFAPAISAISRAGSFVGTQSAAVGAEAMALGNVVTGLVDRLPLRR
ncbi:hypothetical protein [Methylobacterium sp. 10]|uniref:hypothetical protein n=1 Tax=Methylobacterium sp. 10 TaxID=1101191 RepID=UPI0012DD41A2|nr:hypothetical protein [Methylobacterium sp. 10]